MKYDLFSLLMCAMLLSRAATLQAAGLGVDWINILAIAANLLVGAYFLRSILRQLKNLRQTAALLKPLEHLLTRRDIEAIRLDLQHNDDALPGTWNGTVRHIIRSDRP